jgi:uncharacterized repeat protein (TIGR03803 family)
MRSRSDSRTINVALVLAAIALTIMLSSAPERVWAAGTGYPASGLIFDTQGNLYGTTAGDGKKTFGSVFVITP